MNDKDPLRQVVGFDQKHWDDLTLDYGRSGGKVHISHDGTYHFSASLEDGAWVSIPRQSFARLVDDGRLNPDGTVAEARE